VHGRVLDATLCDVARHTLVLRMNIELFPCSGGMAEGFRRAGILNEAVRRSEGEPLLLFTDGDCVPPAAFLDGHVAAHGPRSFAVGGAWHLTKTESAAIDEAAVDAGLHERVRSREEAKDLRRKRWKSLLGIALHKAA
jgi:hypothetical protein